MSRIRPPALALLFGVVALALALSLVIWPAVPATTKLAFFALGFAGGGAAIPLFIGGRARPAART